MRRGRPPRPLDVPGKTPDLLGARGTDNRGPLWTTIDYQISTTTWGNALQYDNYRQRWTTLDNGVSSRISGDIVGSPPPATALESHSPCAEIDIATILQSLPSVRGQARHLEPESRPVTAHPVRRWSSSCPPGTLGGHDVNSYFAAGVNGALIVVKY